MAKIYTAKAIKKDFSTYRLLYVMLIPALVYVLLFNYYPMYGTIIAFKNFVPGKGIYGSDWVGIKHFADFFSSFFFLRVVKNTFFISFWSLIFGFPAPILLALMLNEIRGRVYKRVTQTVSYLPYFVSLVVICSLVKDFTAERGPIGQLAIMLGGQPQSLMSSAKNFYAIYVGSEIWQNIGFGSIIYLAAISTVDMELYDAALIDGAGRFRRIWSVTLPAIVPTIIILLILTLGRTMNVGYEKIILLYSAKIYETADVISTFVYRKGIIEANPSFATAVGLFNSVINFVFLFAANWLSARVSETSLW